MYTKSTVIKVFVSCCSSAFLMEILMTKAPECATLITFLQAFFISLQGFVFTTKFGTIKPSIPIKQYIILVVLFFITNVANNYVYSLHVPSTLHMIIRSASSPVSMLVSWYMLNRIPKLTRAVGSILISAGVALALYGGATIEQERGTFVYWCIGVVILLATLVTGAFTGLQQEMLYAKHGKHPEEMLFYTHALPLVMFIFITPHLYNTALTLDLETWLIVTLNIISQFFCTQSVHQLATKESSVTVTFILTLRKFVSLLLSSIVFKNNVTILHVAGTALVAVGTYVYFDFFVWKQTPVKYKE
ncbi:UDP-xylose and UDP-N-acetylglucosamine transporter-like [Cydia strobilella]|uniref:UDP-xylose and UDP-N-acetylglucosamine transporter-like n=1 Tax=Cydia strobilella TaxID=1100964 RepID=UPI00300406B2